MNLHKIEECMKRECPLINMPLHYQHVIPYVLPRFKRRYEAKFDLNRGAHFNLMVVIHNEHSERWFTDTKLKIEFGKVEKDFEQIKNYDEIKTQFHSHICIYDGLYTKHYFFKVSV